ncbi:helix-turn-helix transcriptional regulator [Shinella zoogloeoides]|uniref:helix-turn-helix transcriptional regulator n=1 Tax=Shinella zoogloeoides TaxID=352475 RepID=UPI0028A86FE1|nr:helix-turn-helix transcriptional regulator [Shinella zoogloeoides]
MKPQATFKQISRMLMDSWISSPDGLDAPESIYRPVRGILRPNMVLLMVDTRSGNPRDFRIDFVQSYGLPSGFADIRLLQRPRSFANFPDQKFLHEVVAPAYVAAVERQRPAMRHILTRVLSMYAAYDRIILPQRNSTGRSAWCIGLIDMHFLLPAGSRGNGLDDADLGILQLLAEGTSTREIADAMSLSPRTIEHRIERLKSAFGAKNISHLVALSISAGISGICMRDN